MEAGACARPAAEYKVLFGGWRCRSYDGAPDIRPAAVSAHKQPIYSSSSLTSPASAPRRCRVLSRASVMVSHVKRRSSMHHTRIAMRIFGPVLTSPGGRIAGPNSIR